MIAPDIWENVWQGGAVTSVRVRKLMEQALRDEVAECRKALDKAPKELTVTQGRLKVNRHVVFTYDVLQRQLERAEQRLKEFLEGES